MVGSCPDAPTTTSIGTRIRTPHRTRRQGADLGAVRETCSDACSQGQRVLVTGGCARSRRRAVPRACVGHGAQAWRSPIGRSDDAGATSSPTRSLGAEAFRVDVQDEAATQTMLARTLEKTLGRHRRRLINNAGISQNLPLALLETRRLRQGDGDQPPRSSYITARAVLRGMIRKQEQASCSTSDPSPEYA